MNLNAARYIYDANAIRVLAGLEGVRRRPAMYIGGTDGEALQRLVFELLDNAVDEALAGACRRIALVLHTDGSCSIEDDGRGIPVDPHPSSGRPACEVVLTTLHSGGKFGDGSYGMTGGVHGVGLSCVNALSERLELIVHRDGREYGQTYARGVPHGDLTCLGESEHSGTRIRFWPDLALFEQGVRFAFETLSQRARQVARLIPGLVVSLRDQSTGQRVEHDSGDGLPGLIRELSQARVPLHGQPATVVVDQDGLNIQSAFQWTSLYAEDCRSFVNTIATSEGGSHVDAVQSALTNVLRRLDAAAPRSGSADLRLQPSDVREGLTWGISLFMSEPRFFGQTKTRLMTPEVGPILERVVERGLEDWFEARPEVTAVVVEKARAAARARHAAHGARERIRFKHQHVEIEPETYRTQFGIRSANWHSSAEWIANTDLLRAHAAACEVPRDARLLDVCCGSGVVGAAFRDRVAHTTGLDITPEMVRLARERLDEVVLGTVFDMPFEAASFDIVVNREAMHLFPSPPEMLREVMRVVKPGGQFIFGQIVPFGAQDAAWMHRIFQKKQPLLHHMFLAEDLIALLQQAGFSEIRTSEHLLWEWIDVWIDSWETSLLHRHEIRELYYNAPAEVRALHPFEITDDGRVRDLWRWVIYSARRPKQD